MSRPRAIRGGATATVMAVTLAGCGATVQPEVAALPVVTAEPVTVADIGRELRMPAPTVGPSPDARTGAESAEPAAPSPADETDDTDDTDDAAATESEPDGSAGPTGAAAAAFVRAAATELGPAEHVVVDLDGDGEDEVVVTGIVGQRAVLRIAWWTDEGYRGLAEWDAGPGLVIEDLRAADVNADDHIEVLVRVEGEGRRSMALFTVLGRGQVVPLEAVGGCHDGSHVYGVTGARLESRQGQPPAIVATCDDSPLPVKDWSEQRWLWRDGAYHFEEPVGRDDEQPEDQKGPSGPKSEDD